MPAENLDLFSFKSMKDNKVIIYYDGKSIMTFSNKKGASLKKKLSAKTVAEQKMTLAKLTGNFKRGNERSIVK